MHYYIFLFFGLFLHFSFATPDLKEISTQFFEYSGTPIVFSDSELPKGNYYDAMPPLSEDAKIEACQILLNEAKKYPKGYLGNIGLKTVGVFAACVSNHNDGYRDYNKEFKGFLYYGLWNRETLSFVAAYYTRGQLPLTFHHEVFHHIDSTVNGKTDYVNYFAQDDLRFKKAISGEEPYSKIKLKKEDIALLKTKSTQIRLKNNVSSYSAKNLGEDQAETARYFMSHLPESLIQITEEPNLPGSQRILHILSLYENAIQEGPNVEWFVDVALERKTIQEKLKTVENVEKEIVIWLDPKKSEKEKNIENPYLKKVDHAISNPSKRAIIRSVQPACVKIGNGSGINISPKGIILTAGHVAKKVNSKLSVEFPDGKKFIGNCTAYSQYYDLAVVEIVSKESLPFAKISETPPEIGTWVTCIGNPGSKTPQGELIPEHTPFYVSVGKIVRFKLDPEKGIFGSQQIGRCIYTAWTYWGHSGSPLFNERGNIVAIHNSWENDGRTRNGIPQQVILDFFKQNKIEIPIVETSNK